MFDGQHVRLSQGRARSVSQIKGQSAQRGGRSVRAPVRRDTTALFPSDRCGHPFFAFLGACLPGRRFLVGRIIEAAGRARNRRKEKTTERSLGAVTCHRFHPR
jgi:hypothetical protein